MTPWIRQSLSIDRNVVEESGTVLVIPGIFRSGKRNRKRDNEEKEDERGDDRSRISIVRRCVVAYSSVVESNRESGGAVQRENVGCISRTLIGRYSRQVCR